MSDAADPPVRNRVDSPEWSRLSLGWCEGLCAAAALIAGVAFTVTGWDEFVGAGRAWVVTLLAVGGGAAVAVVPLSQARFHGAAALAALLAVAIPTGFAYPANALMLVVAAVEAVRAWRTRRRGRAVAEGVTALGDPG